MYDSPARNLTIIQIRSPCFRERRRHFVEQLVAWIKARKFQQVIVLSSAFSQYLADISPEESVSPIRYLSSKISSVELPALKRVQRVEQFTHRPTDAADGILYLPGSGLTRRLFAALQENVNCVVLVKYCSEGDNTADAFHVADTVNQLVAVKQPRESGGRVSWDIPISWSGLFGEGDAPAGVY